MQSIGKNIALGTDQILLIMKKVNMLNVLQYNKSYINTLSHIVNNLFILYVFYTCNTYHLTFY